MVALKLKSGPGYLSIPKKPKRTSSVKGTSLTVVIELSKYNMMLSACINVWSNRRRRASWSTNCWTNG